MANFEGVTASNSPAIKPDKIDKIKEIVDRYCLNELACGVRDGCLELYGYDFFYVSANEPNDMDDEYDKTDNFLKEIAPLLLEKLVIQSVGSEKCRFPLAAQEIVVLPNGDITYNGFKGE